MRRGFRLPMEELAPYLVEIAIPPVGPSPLYSGERGWGTNSSGSRGPSPLYSRERGGGEGGEGGEPPHASAPHPQHLSPEYRGEGSEVLDWQRVFGNANPVEIEVGSGKGLFLVNAGESRPQTNFFGIEIERKY